MLGRPLGAPDDPVFQKRVVVAALKLLERDRFDVVLMDFEMPGMGGLEVTTRLRQRPEFQQLVIIGLTGHSAADELQSARSAGMNGVLCKPLNQAMLNATILSLLRHGTHA